MNLSRRDFFRRLISRENIQEHLDLLPSPLSGIEQVLELGEEPSMEKVALELGASVRRRPSVLDFSALISSDPSAPDGAGADSAAMAAPTSIDSSASSTAAQRVSPFPDTGAGRTQQ